MHTLTCRQNTFKKVKWINPKAVFKRNIFLQLYMCVIIHVFSDLPSNLLSFLSLDPVNYRWLFCYEAGNLLGVEGMHSARQAVLTIAMLLFTEKTHHSTQAKRIPPEGLATVWGTSHCCCPHGHHGIGFTPWWCDRRKAADRTSCPLN